MLHPILDKIIVQNCISVNPNQINQTETAESGIGVRFCVACAKGHCQLSFSAGVQTVSLGEE